jgi:arylsulfatase A
MRSITFALLMVVGAATFTDLKAAEKKPNIVFLLADDLGWTGLSCYGSDLYETPRLDGLAKEGIRFTQAYSACTVCSPTRASILTGQYPARLRLTDFIAGQNRPWAKRLVPDWTKGLKHDVTTLPEALKAAGYQSGIVGKWHLARRGHLEADTPTKHGFDVEYGRPPGTKGYFLSKEMEEETGRSFLTDYFTDRALDFISDSREVPFFLYVAYNAPHTPIQGRPDLVERFKKKVKKGAVHNNPTYAAMVAGLDESVGRILEMLDILKVTDNTLVIFTSDNGGLTQRYGKHDGFTENLPLRRGKGSAYEGGVRVPAIVRWPGKVVPGQQCSTPMMTIDYFPTILEAAGASPGPAALVDGLSLVPLLKDPAHPLERDLFWHYPHYHAGGDGPYSTVRSGNWRLVEFHENRRTELYNLASDVGETTDRASAEPERAAHLRERLSKWRKEIGAQDTRPNPDHDPQRATKLGRTQR